MPRWSWACVLVVLVCLLAAFNAANAQKLSLTVDDSETVVFNSQKDRCDRNDFPDLPARAFRDFAGKTHLFATHLMNYASVGNNLTTVVRDCRLVFAANDSNRPEDFSQWGWLSSFYTTDGKTIWSLVHNEFHGERHPGSCRLGKMWPCWYSVITGAKSLDGGYTFLSPPSPQNLVFAVPYRYSGDQTTRTGVFTPSNIVSWRGYEYALIVFESPDKRGICLVRTTDVGNPKLWRGWDGHSFSVNFVDPYRENIANPLSHTCQPLANLIPNAMGAVVRHEPSGTFIAVQPSTGERGREVGIYYSTSNDLINWTVPQLLVSRPMYDKFQCQDAASYGYPSILDKDSTSRVYDTVTDRPYLYLTRYPLKNCVRGPLRDLVRLNLRISR
jgi:hypothetical protein